MNSEEGLWKLLEGKCSQLAEAVSGGRTPFLLAMAWAFVWSVAIYVNFGGYTMQLVDRHHKLAVETIPLRVAFNAANGASAAASTPSLSQAVDWKCPAGVTRYQSFLDKCVDYIAPEAFASGDYPKGKDSSHCNGTAIAICLARLDANTARYEAAQHESKFVQFAGIPVRVHYSDLGTIGQGGMLLLMAWTYYAFRRENHAIRQFVDFQARDELLPSWHIVRVVYLFVIPSYTLVPQGLFKARHLSFAYASVAQRFLLFLTREGKPLRAATILLFAFPIAVGAFNFTTDIYDDISKNWVRYPDEHGQITFNDLFEALMFFALIAIELRALSEMVESSCLLHGWYVACCRKWDNAWENITDPEAKLLVINVEKQTAEEVST